MSKKWGKSHTPKPAAGQKLKEPEAEPRRSTDHLSPHFCLSYLGGSHPLSACDDEEKAAFADRLFELGQLTWRQIKASDRHKQGHETISRPTLRGVAIPPDIPGDVPILSFRFSGMKSMIGYRTDRLLTILALDRDFSAYKH